MTTKTSGKTNEWLTSCQAIAAGIRRRVLQHTVTNNGGYLSQACSAAEILAALYGKLMDLGDSTGPAVPDPFPGVPGTPGVTPILGGIYNGHRPGKYDRFYLSPAHYALVLYTALIETGRMPEGGLDQFNKDGSTVEMIGAEHSPGFDMMGGSLAQTLSQAAGIALAMNLRKQESRIWVFISDGEFQEGQTWEAVQAMNHYGLDNVTVYADVNAQQCDGLMTEVMTTEPIRQKLESFGATAIEIDGNDISEIVSAADQTEHGRPLFVICRTNPCARMPILEKRRPGLHYVRFTDPKEREEYRQFYNSTMTDGVHGLIREDYTYGD